MSGLRYAIQWLRSLVFIVQMYVVMAIFAVVFLIPMLLHPKGALMAAHGYCKWITLSARWIINLRIEVRGTPPTDQVVVAAKHQSFLDILIAFGALPWAKFIMKRILLFAPILGQYAYRLGCVPVHRGKRGQAIKQMLADVQSGRTPPGQLVIYPQGTRVPPGVHAPYKIGAGVLYRDLNQDCVPMAANVGYFWPKRGIYRRPGVAVIEFLDRIPAGMEIADFMQKIEAEIEAKSNALLEEAKNG